MKEFDIISKYFKKLAINGFSDNLDNDVANINIDNDRQLVISKDMMAEDVHFKENFGGYKIAYKLLASNLSDLASSGARPHSFMLGFAKNDKIDSKFISSFCQGLKELSEEYNLSLIGGDTISCKSELFFSITIFGTCPKNKILSRSKAKEGDLIFVSGDIGDPHLGLGILQNKLNIQDLDIRNYFLDKFYYPKPRIDLGVSLVEKNLSNTAIDISDGLFSDLSHICQSSNLGANIFLEKIPISKNARNLKLDMLDLCSAGEDYEMLFAIKEEKRAKIEKLAIELNIKITEIGFFSNDKNKEIKLFNRDNKKIKIKKYGYEH